MSAYYEEVSIWRCPSCCESHLSKEAMIDCCTFDVENDIEWRCRGCGNIHKEEKFANDCCDHEAIDFAQRQIALENSGQIKLKFGEQK